MLLHLSALTMTDRFTIQDTPSDVPDPSAEGALESTAPKDLQWLETIGDSSDCSNCGAPRSGDYCAQCGQRHLRQRMTFASVAKRVFSEVTDIDRGFLHTTLGMVIRPGQVVKDYVSGRQKPYVNPLTYFLLGATLQLLVLWIIEPFMRQAIDAQFSSLLADISAEKKEDLTKLYGEDPATFLADTYIFAIQNTYTYGAFFFFAIPFALLLAWSHRLTGEKFRVGESLVYALFVFGHMLMLTAIVNLVLIPIALSIQPIFALLVYFVYPQFAHRPFFRGSFGSRAMTFFSTLGASIVFGSSLLATAAIAVLLRVLWVKYSGG